MREKLIKRTNVGIKPKNGMYLDREDFMPWNETMSVLISEKKNAQGLKVGGELKNEGLAVKNVTFILTEDCNLRCTYCYLQGKTHRRMTKEVAKKAVDFLFNEEGLNDYISADRTPAIVLDFIGGEPLLEIETMDFIVDYLTTKAHNLNHPWAYNYRISLTTNGILYNTPEFQNFLNKNEGKVSATITIDGNKELHDSCRVFPDGSPSYDIVEDAMKVLIKRDGSADTKLTLAPENLSFLYDAIVNLYNLGLTSVNANPVFEEGWDIDDARLYYKLLKDLADLMLDNELYEHFHVSLFEDIIGDDDQNWDSNWCGGDGSMLAIGVDGQCFPCLRYAKYSLATPGRKEQPIGSLDEGMDSPEDNKFLCGLQDITMATQSNEKCLNCPVGAGCSICSGYHYDKFGDANIRATYICEMHQARVLANVYYWNKLYQKLGLDKKFEMNSPKDWALEIISEDEYNMLYELGGVSDV